jgi:Ni/Co efflux regulator RcnB
MLYFNIKDFIMKARFVVIIFVALSFLGTSLFAAQATQQNQTGGKAKTEKVTKKKARHHKKRSRKGMASDSTAKKPMKHSKKSSTGTKGNK